MKTNSVLEKQHVFGIPQMPIHVGNGTHVSVNRHSHNFYELVFIKEGFCMHSLEDSVSLVMEGDLFLIKPGMHHKYTGNKTCRIINCLFTDDVFEPSVRDELLSLPGLPQMLLPSKENIPPIHLNMTERKLINGLLTQMVNECAEKKAGWFLKVRSILCELMIEYSRLYEIYKQRLSDKNIYLSYVTKALDYIDEHYSDETLSVQRVGEYTGISGDHLSRQFRKTTGTAVQEYIRRYRLSKAINFLQQGYSVGETATLCGFHSIGYFSREFKKEMGVTPSQHKTLF